jgi:FkbM family methyltransferase
MKLVQNWYLPEEDVHFQQYLNQNQNYQFMQRLKSLKFTDSFNLAIDIGACVGFWAKDLCKIFNEVICFEPYNPSADCLEKNLNYYKNYKLHRTALSNNEHGTKRFFFNKESIGGNSFEQEIGSFKNFIDIPKRTLDSFNLKNVNYIKMDVQFHELEVLKGATKTLTNNDPVLCIECSQRNEKEINYTNEIIQYLKELKYSITGKYIKEIFFKKI